MQRGINGFDIYEYPKDPAKRIKGDRVVQGDLHGNAIRLMAYAINESIIKTDLSSRARREIYSALVNIYRSTLTNGLTQSDIDEFDVRLMNFRKVKSTAKVSMLIAGDDICDRGGSDLLMFLVYKRLHELKVKYTILASNHGLDFLYQYFSPESLTGNIVSLYLISTPDASFGKSLKSLRDFLLKEENASWLGNIDLYIQDYYIKHLKLLDYDYAAKNSINLYTHAPTYPAQMVGLFYELKAALESIRVDFPYADKDFKAADVIDLSQSIDAMNAWFALILKHPELFTQLMGEDRGELYAYVHNRYSDLDKAARRAIDGLFGQFSVNNYHGHTGEGTVFQGKINGWTFLNMDTDLGKRSIEGEENNVGLYKSCAIQAAKSLAEFSDLGFVELENDEESTEIDSPEYIDRDVFAEECNDLQLPPTPPSTPVPPRRSDSRFWKGPIPPPPPILDPKKRKR